jgi:hypothetical protein
MSEAQTKDFSSTENGRGCGFTLSRLLAWALAIAFVVSFPLTLLVFDLAQVLFSPDEIAAAFSDELVASGVMEEAMVELLLGGELAGSSDVAPGALEGALDFFPPAGLLPRLRRLFELSTPGLILMRPRLILY